jgi:hypothetical protein
VEGWWTYEYCYKKVFVFLRMLVGLFCLLVGLFCLLLGLFCLLLILLQCRQGNMSMSLRGESYYGIGVVALSGNTCRTLGTWYLVVAYRGNGVIHRGIVYQLQGDDNGHVGRPC